MKLQRLLAVLIAAIAVQQGLGPPAAKAQEYEAYPLEARVWLDRGHEPVLSRGDRVRIYYRVSESAFVAIFQIDSNGTARMIFPSSPRENHYARADRDYRILFPGSSYWYVDDDPGMGYFFIVASPVPFDFSAFGPSQHTGSWDLSYVGGQVYGDPYLAMDEYVAALVPDWEYVAYGLDFTAYHVDNRYEYPRFLCYDCHGFRPYQVWNPYAYSCLSYRVVIYNDPYYYPVTRYRGTRVVYVQPRRGVAQFVFKERARGEPGTPQVVVRNTPAVSQPGVEGGEVRRAVPRTGTPAAVNPVDGTGRATAPAGQARPGVEGTSTRRPAGTAPATVTPPSRPTAVLPGRGGAGVANPPRVTPPGQAGTSQRPVLERRPPGSGSSATPPATATPPRTSVTRPTTGGGGSGAAVTRPTTGGGSSGGAVTRPASGSSSSGRAVTRPTTGGGSSGGAVTRPTTGGGSSGGAVTRPASGSSSSGRAVTRPATGNGGTSRAVTRPTTGGGSSGGAVTRPASGSSTSGRAVTRPTTGGGSSGGAVTRPASGSSTSGRAVTRPATGNGGTSRAVTRPATGGSSSAAKPPPARATKPPVRRPGGGGGLSPA